MAAAKMTAPRTAGARWTEVEVPDQRVDADGGGEARGAGDEQGLPQAARRLAAPDAEQARSRRVASRAAAEAGAVVGDERDQPRVDRVQVGRRPGP